MRRVSPVKLYVNAATGYIAKLSTMETDPLRRDVAIEVMFDNWAPAQGGLAFPGQARKPASRAATAEQSTMRRSNRLLIFRSKMAGSLISGKDSRVTRKLKTENHNHCLQDKP